MRPVASSGSPAGQIVAHLIERIDGSELVNEPFPYMVTDDALPSEVFDRLIADMPDVTELTPMSEIGLRNVAQYRKHSTALFHELSGRSDPQVWRAVADAVLDLSLEQHLRKIFAPHVPAASDPRAVKKEVRLDCGRVGAHLDPHTDSPIVLFKCLLYLRAPSDHPTADTILYAPKDNVRRTQALGGHDDFTVDSYTHESASDHVEVARVKFKPNRMWTFFRTPASLHGLDELTEESAPRFIMAGHYKFATV